MIDFMKSEDLKSVLVAHDGQFVDWFVCHKS